MQKFKFHEWILQNPKNFYMRCILYRYIVYYYVDTLPPLKPEWSAEKKRFFIRQHINGLKAFESINRFNIKNIDEYKIYSMTCKTLADKHGLNNKNN